MSKFNSALDGASKAIESMREEHEALQASAAVLGMSVMSVEQIPITPNIGSTLSWFGSLYRGYGQPDMEWCHREATRNLQALRVKIDKIHESNSEAMKNNALISEAVENMMKGLGIPPRYRYRGKRSSRHRKIETLTATAGWVQDLRRTCLTDDGYDAAIDGLAKMGRKYDHELANHKAKAAKEKQQREADLLKQAAVTEAIAYLQSEGLSAPSDYTIETAVEAARVRKQGAVEHLNENWLDVICGDSARFKTESDELADTWRWGTEHSITVVEIKTGRRFCAYYRRQPEYGIQDCNHGIEWHEIAEPS